MSHKNDKIKLLVKKYFDSFVVFAVLCFVNDFNVNKIDNNQKNDTAQIHFDLLLIN